MSWTHGRSRSGPTRDLTRGFPRGDAIGSARSYVHEPDSYASRRRIAGTISDVGGSVPAIDICRALCLLEKAVTERGEHCVFPPVANPGGMCFYGVSEGPACIVGAVLSLAQVGADRLDIIREYGVREPYRKGRLPVRLTLGALAVLDAAQRSQDRGHPLGDVVEHAIRAADRFLDLAPDVVLKAFDDRTTSAQSPGLTHPARRQAA
jgi:hypothetical protein